MKATVKPGPITVKAVSLVRNTPDVWWLGIETAEKRPVYEGYGSGCDELDIVIESDDGPQMGATVVTVKAETEDEKDMLDNSDLLLLECRYGAEFLIVRRSAWQPEAGSLEDKHEVLFEGVE